MAQYTDTNVDGVPPQPYRERCMDRYRDRYGVYRGPVLRRVRTDIQTGMQTGKRGTRRATDGRVTARSMKMGTETVTERRQADG